MTNRHAAWAAYAVGVFLSVAALAAEPTALAGSLARVSVDIRAQSLHDALRDFGTQTGVQVLYRSEDVATAGLTAPRVAGELAAGEVLRQLLSKSKLVAEFVNPKTVRISSATEGVKPGDKTSQAAVAGGERIRLAQAEPGVSPSASSSVDASADEGRNVNAANQRLDEVIVTGSHIRGGVAIGSELIVLDQAYIQRTGYATLEDVIRTIPQVAPGPNQSDFNAGNPPGSLFRNFGGGTGINLRGLGANATLVLVDGVRQAASGTGGNFVDISSIPLTAVERIEILPDGASAIYGSDAVGGVVNIILKRHFNGLETRVSFGTLNGDSNELRATQLAGFAWEGGNLFGGLEYYKRGVLLATDRPYSTDSDQRRNGGDNFSSRLSLPGNIYDNTFQPAFAVPRNQDGTGLSVSDLIPVGPNLQGANLANSNFEAMLVPDVRKTSVFLNFSQQIGSRTEIQSTFRYNRQPISYATSASNGYLTLPTSNPYYLDAFGDGSPLTVAYSFGEGFPLQESGRTDTYIGTLAGLVSLDGGWQARLNGSYAVQSMHFTFTSIDTNLITQALGNPPFFGDPTYDPTAQGYFNPLTGEITPTNRDIMAQALSTLEEAAAWRTIEESLTLDGPLFALPAGSAQLAAGVGYRAERGDSGNAGTRVGDLGESVRSVFAELQLPIFTPAHSLKGFRELRFSLAGRYEQYVGYQNTFNPKLGFTWSPVAPLSIRASWGTSFRAPSPAERDTTVFHPVFGSAVVAEVLDPTSASGVSTGLFLISGVNPSLHEERAKSWSVGLDLKFAETDSPLRASLTYYDTRYKDRIGTAGFPGQEGNILEQEAVWRDVINRNPTAALIDELCAPPAGDGTCSAVNPSVVVDMRSRNIALQINRGIDAQIEKLFRISRGTFGLSANVNRTLKNETALSETTDRIDVLDELGAPLRWKARASAFWDYGVFSLNASLNYVPSYSDPGGNVAQGSGTVTSPRTIESWRTADLGAVYRTSTAGWLSDLTAALKIVNAFNRRPPYVNTPLGFDLSNANPYGRTVSIDLSKAW